MKYRNNNILGQLLNQSEVIEARIKSLRERNIHLSKEEEDVEAWNMIMQSKKELLKEMGKLLGYK